VNQQDAAAPEAAERIVSEAARRACIVAPAIQITTHLQAGETAAAVLREGSQDALIVLGRGRKAARFSPVTRSLGWQLARRASCPVTMVELFDEASRGPSAGRVVVAVDGTAEPTAALGFAFRAALRRGVGITMLHAWSHDLGAQADDQAAADSFSCCAVEDALRMCRDVFPEVEVRQRYVAGPAGRALAAESAAAALVVLGSRAHGRLHRAIFGSVEHAVLRSARCPVAIVRTPPAGGQQLSGHGGGCW
jgi:nucleotide-binding universal stress UspA family protein